MKNEKINPIRVDQILVPHKDFNNAKLRIEMQIKAGQLSTEPTCIAVVGESRTGKSRLLKNITQQFPKDRTSEGAIVPVLCVRTPSKPTVKALVEVLLREIGDPLWFKRGSENEKTEQLYTLLKQTKTHTVVIDEFQHFYDKVSHKVQHYLSDWLKIFVDRSGLMLIVAGLPDCMAVINQNQQLRGRFLAPIHMPRFNWNDEDAQDEFIACLKTFQEGLKHYDFPDLGSDEMAFRFYCATGGLIGYVAKILHQACLNAQDSNKKILSLEDFAKSFDESIWKDAVIQTENPFSEDFDITPTIFKLETAMQIGVGSYEDIVERPSRRKSKKDKTAAEALTQ